MEIKKIGFVFVMLMLAMLVMPAMAATPVPEPKMGEDGWVNPTGALYVSLMCHHNLISKDVLIYRIADNNTIFFVNGALVSKEAYDMVPKMMDYPKTIQLNDGGQFDVFFNPGSYALKLNDGNGGQPEYALVTLYQGGKTSVVFIGHAVSFDHGEPQCVPDETFTIVSAKYGALGQKCEDVSDNNAHTEYAYWITGTPAHTEYSFRDWIPAGTMEVCHAEVNHTEYSYRDYVVDVAEHTETVVDVPAHTEYQISTYQMTKAEIPATPATGTLANLVCVKKFLGICVEYDYESGHVHAEPAPHDNPLNPNRFVYDSHTYKIVGDKHAVAFIVTPGTPLVPAEYGWVITTPYTDGTCPAKVACAPTVGDTKCDERSVAATYKDIIVPATYKWTEWSAYSTTQVDAIPGQREVQTKVVVDHTAYCEQVEDPQSPAHWGDWSAFSDTPVTAIPDQREVRTQDVPDDMVNGHYSEWSDVPEGSCAPRDIASIESIQVNEPCITREVPSTTHKECVDVGLYADVTAQVQALADDGINSFVFDNRPSPGGIFSTTGTLLTQIQDPAYGYIKTVEIVYNDGCSEDKTVTGNEYAIITLGTLVPEPKQLS